MNSTDELPEKIEAPESTSAPAELAHKLDEPASIEHFERASDQRRPVEDLHSLLLRISHHLDYETSERSTIYYRLLALDAQGKRIEKQTKRRVLRRLVRYLVVILLGVAGTLAWQSYGEATKQIVAARAPELGWSPETKQMIASWIQELGWTTSPSAPNTSAGRLTTAVTPKPIPAAQTAAEVVAPKVPAAVDPEQVQQILRGLTALQQTVDQLATAQDHLARQITSLQAADSEILNRVPAPPPLPPLPPPAPARKPTPASSARAPAVAR